MTPAVRAVLFDIGGVIADSPVMAIRRHCRQVGAPDINPFLGASDAWNAYMRGDLSRGDFVHNLTREMEVASQAPLDVEALLDDVFGAQGGHRPLMIRALKRLRKHGGLLIGALTNNWVAEPEVDEVAEAARQAESAAFRALFDVFVESSVTGMQKPDPRIYQLALSQLGQLPAETVVFLDDLGVNLKAARALGIRTIKVNNETEWQWLEALAELETWTGVELLGAEEQALILRRRSKL